MCTNKGIRAHYRQGHQYLIRHQPYSGRVTQAFTIWVCSGCVLGVYRKFEESRSMIGSSLSVDGLCEQELLKGTAMGKHTHVF